MISEHETRYNYLYRPMIANKRKHKETIPIWSPY